MSKVVYGYRGNALKVPFSNYAEKEAIIEEALDKGCFVMDEEKDDNSFIYITGEQTKIESNLTKLNYISVDFDDLDLSFVAMDYIVDISLVSIS